MLDFKLALKSLQELKTTSVITYIDHYLIYAADYLGDVTRKPNAQDGLAGHIKDTISSMIKIMCYDQTIVKVHSHRYYPDGKSINLPELALAGYEIHWVESGISVNGTSPGFQWKIIRRDSMKIVCAGSSQLR